MNDVPTAPRPLPALARLGRLVRKELSEILRDRRTIVTLVLMPVLLYPLLSIAFQQFFLATVESEPVTVYMIALTPSEWDDDFIWYLQYRQFHVAREAGAVVGFGGAGPFGAAAVGRLIQFDPAQPPQPQPSRKPPQLKFFAAANLEEVVRAHEVHLAVRLRKLPGIGTREPAFEVQFLYLQGSPNSLEALRYVERELMLANAYATQDRLWQQGVWERVAPWRAEIQAVGVAEPSEGLSLAALVPLVLVLMTITGAVYPAIDLTAGERERGTLEILVAAPVPRLALLFAKYVAVVTVALLTAVVNLVMMVVTLQVSGLAALIFGEHGLTAAAVLPVFGLLILFALFFSAVLLALTSFARSFKEAQAYLIPLMLAALAPGVAGLLPGLHLSGLLTVVPLLNIVLLARDLLQGVAVPAVAGVVVLSTLLYAAAAVGVAARIFGAEAVLYSEQSSWADLFRRPRQPCVAAPVSTALLCLALMFPLTFVLRGVAAQVTVGGLAARQQLGLRVGLVALVSVALFGLLPLFAAARGRVSLTTGFRLRRPPLAALAGGLLLGVGLWPFVIEQLALFRDWGLAPLGQHGAERVAEQLGMLRRALPPLLLVAAFVVPALAEEWFFRGFLFASLRSALGPRATVVTSALLFGLFHLVADAFALERLLPSTVLGLVLGWVAYRSGSVVPGMVLHACHNGFLVGVSYLDTAPEGHLPADWLLGAAAVAAVGGVLVWLCRPTPEPVDLPLAA